MKKVNGFKFFTFCTDKSDNATFLLLTYFPGIFIRFLENLENQIKQYLIEIFSITNLTFKNDLFSGCPELQKNHQWGSEVDSLDKFSYPKSCQEACLIDSDCADGNFFKIMLLNHIYIYK